MQTTKNWQAKSIVLAEDDADDRMIFEETIQQLDQGIRFQIVSDGDQLLNLLENFLSDILFLDLDMPRKNGLECLISIRSNERIKDLPIVMFSSTSRPSNIQTAYDMGAHLFLIKSSFFQEYTSALKAILKLDWNHPEKIKEQYCLNNRYAAFT